jgi:hypothetical protein
VLVFRIDLISAKILKRRLLGMVQKWKIHVSCTSRIREIMYSINSYHKLLSVSVKHNILEFPKTKG